MEGKGLVRILTFCILVAGFSALSAQTAAEGKALFKQQCSSCHALNKKIIGPALAGVPAKYAGDEEWLYKWIRNAPGLIASGDAKAVKLYEENGKQQMSAFPSLTDAQIQGLLAYMKEGDGPAVDPKGPITTAVTDPLADPAIYYSLLGLVGVLALITLLLVVITATLVTAVRAKEQKEAFTFADVLTKTREILRNKFVITAAVCFIFVMGTAKLIAEARTIGLHQGYMPTQPIAYSHKLHAGEYQIACQYCHAGASKSKSAWIPSANVCMNCHKAIAQKEYPGDAARTAQSKAEIAKIYAAVGWDPDAFQYIAGYEEKPIEWIRIHNTPDHAYFNHAQHVVVGGIECQTCHGPIQEMEVVYQYTELGMGWCINCHRNQKVKVLGQDNSDDLTVEDMGGLNCARCHY
ncbi:MAG: cytochrome C [Bacteroidetes bacterium]|nr:MAG: cytochrome C [Bacteroidota bacterium]